MQTSANCCEEEDSLLEGRDVSALQYGGPAGILRLGEQSTEGIEWCYGDIKERGKDHV